MGCFCDYDAPEFHLARERTARKEHKCCECGHVIKPGETYEHATGKWDGHIGNYHTCQPCADLRDALADSSGGCFQYGGLRDEYFEYLNNLYYRSEDVDIHDIYRRVMAKHRAGSNAELRPTGAGLSRQVAR